MLIFMKRIVSVAKTDVSVHEKKNLHEIFFRIARMRNGVDTTDSASANFTQYFPKMANLILIVFLRSRKILL